jgi:hypothetical protein
MTSEGVIVTDEGLDASVARLGVLKGAIRLAAGRPAVGLNIVAFTQLFRTRRKIGSAKTDEGGHFSLTYPLQAEGDRGTSPVLLGIYVVTAGRRRLKIFETATRELLHPQNAELVIDVVLSPDADAIVALTELTEYERISERLRALTDEVPFADIAREQGSDDGEFLARASGIEVAKIAHVVVAHRLTDLTDIPPEFFYALLREEGLYGLSAKRPRAVMTPVRFTTDTRAVLTEVALLEWQAAVAAVRRAAAKRVISDDVLDRLDDIHEVLERRRPEATGFINSELPRRLFGLVEQLILSDKAHEMADFVQKIGANDLRGLYAELDAQGAFTADGGNAARSRLHLADLLGYNTGLVEKVARTLPTEREEDIRELARLTRREWSALLTANLGAVTVGERKLEAGRVRKQASLIVRRFEREYPTTALSAQLARHRPAAIPDHAEIATFLDEHPALDLLDHNLVPYLKSVGVEAPDLGLVRKVEKVQRVLQLVGDYPATVALMGSGYTASADIVAAGKTQFLRDAKASAGMGKTRATEVFVTAQNTNFAAISIAAALQGGGGSQLLMGGGVTLAPQIEKIIADQPDLKSLFGSTDAGECSECNSIYGPAAYLADIIRFIDRRLVKDTTVTPIVSTRSAKDVLFSRRPDLGEIDLNCDNARIPVPHIDMICELLEEAAAPDAGFSYTGPIEAGVASPALVAAVRAAGYAIGEKAAVYGPYAPDRFTLRDAGITIAVDGPGPVWKLRRLRQTHGTAAERAAAPEYVNPTAYAALSARTAAFDLPFDLFHLETRSFLADTGATRLDLLTGFGGTREQIDAELLGLPMAESTVIFTPDVPAQPGIWGVPGPTAAATLKMMDVFTVKTRLDYRGVERLIAGAFIRGTTDLYIRHLDSTVNLSRKEIVGLDDAALDRIHRTLRLSRKTGMDVGEIGRIAVAPRLGGGSLGPAARAAIADLSRLSTSTSVPVPELITWFSTIPAEGGPSGFAGLFANPAATGAVNPLLAPAAVAANPGLGAAAVLLTSVELDLAIGLGTTPAAVQSVTARQAELTGSTPVISFENIAAVYARIALARALGHTVDDLLGLERLATIDPLASTSALADFIDLAATVRASRVAVGELTSRLTGTVAGASPWDLTSATVDAAATALASALVDAAAAHQSAFDDDLDSREQLGAFEAALRSLPSLVGRPLDPLLDLVRLDVVAPAVAAEATSLIQTDLMRFVNSPVVVASIGAIVAVPGEASRSTFLRLVLDGLAAAARRASTEAAVVDGVATTLDLPVGDVAAMLGSGDRRGLQMNAGGATIGVREILSSGHTVAAPGQPDAWLWDATPADIRRGFRLAHSAGRLLRQLTGDAAGIAFLVDSGAALGWLDLSRLPVEPAMPPVSLDSWRVFVAGIELLATYPDVTLASRPGVAVSAVDTLRTAALGGPLTPALTDQIAALTNWAPARVEEIAVQDALDALAFTRPSTWRLMESRISMLTTLGSSLPAVLPFLDGAMAESHARDARALAKARYADVEWLGTLARLMNPIREAKRDALVGYLLVTNPGIDRVDDLFDYFMTDPQWSAKMPSSRLVHAHETVQYFARSCLDGSQPRAVADLAADPDWAIWESMAWFRLWQVPRKVFVETGYHLQPALRDDKTEAFQALESQIMQGPLDEESIEAAYEGYLDALDQLAFLDVLATCYDLPNATMHVFARTKGGEPREYYHRTLVRERFWTPWRKVDLDISGDSLIAFFRNKRLNLVWATFLDKGLEDDQNANFPTPGMSLPRSRRFTEVRIAVSYFTGKKWVPRRISEDALATVADVDPFDSRRVVLGVTAADHDFTVDVGVSNENGVQSLGHFLLTGCKGYPEISLADAPVYVLFQPTFDNTELRSQRFFETAGEFPLAYSYGHSPSTSTTTLFGRTPGRFRVTYPFQASEIDRVLTAFARAAGPALYGDFAAQFYGTLMPFFFEDNLRGYILTPGFYGQPDERSGSRTTRKTFSIVRQLVLEVIALATKYLLKLAQASTQAEKNAVIQALTTDPEFSRIVQEVASYRGLDFGFVVRNFSHPRACDLRERFFEGGVARMLARSSQLEVGDFVFEDPGSGYAPTASILPAYPRQAMDFDVEDAYAGINWELAVHIPHFVADLALREGDIGLADTHLSYIFDARGTSEDPEPQRYWNAKPFYLRSAADYQERLIDSIMNRLAHDPNGVVETELVAAVMDWRRNPFKPYAVARSRTVEIQRAIVLLKAKLAIAAGRQHFAIGELEHLAVAATKFSQASRILGPRPASVPPAVPVPPATYNELESTLDAFGNALRTLENLVPDLSALPHQGAELPPPPLALESLYFCIPPAEKVTELHDEIEELQFNLRNSRTIDGVEREIALFAPRLSVDDVLAASAAGLSIDRIMSDLSAARPPFRFRVMLRHSIELAESALAFGQRYESTRASSDAEGLARLKADQATRFLDEQVVTLTNELEIARQGVLAAKKAADIQAAHEAFYSGRPYTNTREDLATAAYGVSLGLQSILAVGYIAAGGLALIPKFTVGAAGFGGSPHATVATGGDLIEAGARDAMVGAIGALSGVFDKTGSLLDKQASYQIRSEDWGHSAATAHLELERAQLEEKVAGIRRDNAVEARRLHGIKQRQAAAEEEYLRAKATSAERLSTLAAGRAQLAKGIYKVALESAAATAQCFNFERGATRSFVRGGQWDETGSGRLAAENLVADLRAMEHEYYETNARRYEITKHVSLARLDPLALLELRVHGRCEFSFPELIFDLDNPGHKMRRIRALTVSLPAVIGPQTSTALKLTQVANRVRTTSALSPNGYDEDPVGDPRFKYNVGAMQSIVTSRGEDDGGVFSVDLNDERYLPFEGSGLIGTFIAELPAALPAFDRMNIADLVIKVMFEAEEGGRALREAASANVKARLNSMKIATTRSGLHHPIDLRRDRPDVWQQLVASGESTLTIGSGELPYLAHGGAALGPLRVLVRTKSGTPTGLGLRLAGGSVVLANPPEEGLQGLHSANVAGLQLDTEFTLAVSSPSDLRDVYLIARYELT